MSWQNNPSFNPDEAQQRGVDVYEVLVTDWSRNDPGLVNLQWPPVGQSAVGLSLAGIAIGPRSTIDRCWVSYNLQKHKLTSDVVTTDRMRRLSVDAPLIYAQAALAGFVPDLTTKSPYQLQAEKGPLIVTAYAGIFNNPTDFSGLQYPGGLLAFGPVDSTVIPASYTDVNGVDRTFEVVGSTPGPAAPGALWPVLHLLLYLKAPPTFVPTKRFPLILRGEFSAIANANQEVIIAQIPIYGRRHIRIMLRGTAASNSFRVGAIRALADYTPIFEEPVDSITGVGNGVPVVLSSCAGQDLNADYLNIYGSSLAGPVDVSYQFSAYD